MLFVARAFPRDFRRCANLQQGTTQKNSLQSHTPVTTVMGSLKLEKLPQVRNPHRKCGRAKQEKKNKKITLPPSAIKTPILQTFRPHFFYKLSDRIFLCRFLLPYISSVGSISNIHRIYTFLFLYWRVAEKNEG